MSCGWKVGLGWGEEVSEKGSVKQTKTKVVFFNDVCVRYLLFIALFIHLFIPLYYLDIR